MTPAVFVDTDVIISSLLSSKGAAYFLLRSKAGNWFISNFSRDEIIEVCKRLKISPIKARTLLKKLETMAITEKFIAAFAGYVSDSNDAHIVAGAAAAKVKFLITYNAKHYKVDKIREELKIIVLLPALFLQWARSGNRSD